MNHLELLFIDKLGIINYLWWMENKQNVLKFKISEHFLNWITISGLKKS